MDTIANLKEQVTPQTPLLLYEAVLANGQTERWCTHRVTVGGEAYQSRVVRQNLFEVQTASDSGIDAIPKISLTLANADSYCSQIESNVGFKGAKLKVTFLFHDLKLDTPATESQVLFQGILNPPEEFAEETVRLSAINRMNMQRVLLPPVRIQRRCPWEFPATQPERAEAVDGGTEGRYSRFFRCGYSAGEPGGVGNLNGGAPFTSCSFTRADCLERGMFDTDAGAAVTRRFGGIEFVPPTVRVRSHGERQSHDSPVVANEARYNDFVPLVYGTGWLEPPVVFARNDGNLTRMEVLLATGRLNQVVKVLVNNVEIPEGISGRDMTGTGWWNLFADGERAGGFNLNFVTIGGAPLGDPYGSMACLSVVAPNQINDGRVLPRVKVLVEGLRLERFDGNGVSLGTAFTNNPAWILLDTLRRTGWRLEELDLPSFSIAAGFADETIAATDNNGNPISVKRFQCDLVLRTRRTAADVLRGIRNNARLQLTYRNDGRLALNVENSILLQQPTKPVGSNAPEMVNGGWPAYLYSDASAPGIASGILRRADDSSSVRLWSRPIADTPNRFAIEFADVHNEYQQDSLAFSDVEDIARTGQEITGRFVADGLPSFDQAARILKFALDRSLKGNRYIEFETSVKALGQHVGDLITVNYAKEGLLNQPFRILKIQPSGNFRSVRIGAQIHDDAWYNDTNGQLTLIPPTVRQPESEPRMPDSLYGAEIDEFGREQFTIVEYQFTSTDGAILTEVEVGFTPPEAGRSLAAGIPIVNLQPLVQTTGGSLAGGQTLYYAVTATDAEGLESNASFIVRAKIPAGTATNAVTLNGLSFSSGAASFNVYRGLVPSRLMRIAVGVALAASFTDSGLAAELSGAPDPHYDHANFYWRIEDTEEKFASVFGPNSVGSDQLAMTAAAYAGHAVRLIRGKGEGQERTVATNTDTTLFVSPNWEVEPDESTVFVVSENTWHFGGRARSSPARFQVPNRNGRVLQITGRSANAHNVESLEKLAIVTRWRIGGGGLGVADTDVPPEPSFGVTARGDGTLEFGGIGFPVLENTQTISTGTFQLYYRIELSGPSEFTLSTAINDTDTTISLNQAGPALAGDLMQLDAEILKVSDVQNGGLDYVVERGQCLSTAASHASGAPVVHLQAKTLTVPFESSFFGTVPGGAWTHSEWIPNIRLACANLWVTNRFGQSPVGTSNYSALMDGGLRTLRGGQFNFQVEGLLAILDDAVPLVSVQDTLSIRDVYATVKEAPSGAAIQLRIRQDGVELTLLSIADGQVVGTAVNGAGLAVLQAGSNLSLDVVTVGAGFPGRDLTVTIRV